MSKNEKYKSPKARAKHESKETSKERIKEYGAKGAKVKKVMHEWKAGTLHSGKGGKVVKSRKQAIAIALSEGRKATRRRGK
jgi:hypothetical protein